MAVLYLHKRKSDNQVFYIGIGKDIRRAYRKDQRNKHWVNYTNKYEYFVEILCNSISWEEACEKERELICFYGRKDLGFGNLLNMTDGGEGTYGRVLTLEHKHKLSISKKGKMSIETLQKAWNKNRGRKLTLEHKIKISKPVLQYDKNGNFIKEYYSITEAQRILNCSHIGEVCNGHRKTSGGFIWKYKN